MGYPNARQPPVYCEASSLAVKLGFSALWVFNEVHPQNLVPGSNANAVYRTRLGAAASGMSAGLGGFGAVFASTSRFTTSQTALDFTGPGSLIWVDSGHTSGTAGAILDARVNSATGACVQVDTNNIYVVKTGTGGNNITATNGRRSDGSLNFCGFTLAANTNGVHKLYSNGALLSSASPTVAYTNATGVAIGNNQPATAPFGGILYMLGFVRGAVLSDSVMQILTQNPWVLLQALPGRRGFTPPLGGSSFTKSLSASSSMSAFGLRSPNARRSSTSTMAAALLRAGTTTKSGIIVPAAALVKQPRETKVAATTAVGAASKSKVTVSSVAASSALSAVVVRAAARIVAASSAASAALVRAGARTVSASSVASAAVARVAARALSASSSVSAVVARAPARILVASSSVLAAARRAAARVLTAGSAALAAVAAVAPGSTTKRVSFARRRMWNEQPPEATAVDWANPINRGLLLWSQTGDSRLDSTGFSHPSVSGSLAHSIDTYGRTRQFDGASFINVGAAPIFNDLDAITILCWFRAVSGITDNPQLVAKDGNTGGRSFTFDILEDAGWTLRFYVNGGIGGSGVDIIVVPGISLDTDYLAVVTYSSAGCNIYLDGVLVASDTFTETIPNSTAPVEIGARTYSGFEGYFLGPIRLAGIWNRALSETEVRILTATPWRGMMPRRQWIAAAAGATSFTSTLTASLSITAALSKARALLRSASSNLGAALTRLSTRVLSAGSTLQGVLAHAPQRVFNAASTATASVTRSPRRTVFTSSSMQAVVVLIKSFLRSLAASMTLVGVQARSYAIVRAATLSLAAALSFRLAALRTFSASSTLSGSRAGVISVTRSAASSMLGNAVAMVVRLFTVAAATPGAAALQRFLPKSLAASSVLSGTAALRLAALRAFNASTTVGASLVRTTSVTRAASSTTAPTLFTQLVTLRAFSAAAGSAAAMRKDVGAVRAAASTLAASLTRALAAFRTPTASITVAPVVMKQPQRSLFVSSSLQGAVDLVLGLTTMTLLATVSTVASVARSVFIRRSAAASLAGTRAVANARVQTASSALAAARVAQPQRQLQATFGSVGALTAVIGARTYFLTVTAAALLLGVATRSYQIVRFAAILLVLTLRRVITTVRAATTLLVAAFGKAFPRTFNAAMAAVGSVARNETYIKAVAAILATQTTIQRIIAVERGGAVGTVGIVAKLGMIRRIAGSIIKALLHLFAQGGGPPIVCIHWTWSLRSMRWAAAERAVSWVVSEDASGSTVGMGTVSWTVLQRSVNWVMSERAVGWVSGQRDVNWIFEGSEC